LRFLRALKLIKRLPVKYISYKCAHVASMHLHIRIARQIDSIFFFFYTIIIIFSNYILPYIYIVNFDYQGNIALYNS